MESVKMGFYPFSEASPVGISFDHPYDVGHSRYQFL